MIETELKAMLSKEQYDKIENMFQWDWVKDQINSYYSDTSGELRKNGITFRVRTKDNTSVVQVKKHQKQNSALQVCEESEFPIPLIPQAFSPENVEQMAGIKVGASLLGSLTTTRHSLIYCDGVEICLDKSKYLDRLDYEIEIEYTKEIPKELLEKLSSVGVDFSAKCSGKCSRFMRRLSEIVAQ